MVTKLGISISLVGFIGVGVLLLTNHPGVAIRVSNYLYFLVLVTITYVFIFEK